MGLGLRLFHLGHQSLWVDEVFTWMSASPQAPLSAQDVWTNTHGPLLSALLHVWMHLAGSSEFALRLPVALASTLLVVGLAYLARAVAGPRTFLPMAWLAAVSPFLVWYGQELRNYAFAMLFAALAMLAAVRYRESGSARWLVVLGTVSIAGALSNFNVLLLAAGMLVALIASPPPGRGRFAGPLAVSLAVALALAPWILHALGALELHRLVPGRGVLPAETPLRGETTFTWAALPYTFYVFSVGYTLGPSLRLLHADPSLRALLPHAPGIALAALVFGTCAVAGVRALARRPAVLGLVAAALVVPFAAVVYFALMNFKPYNPRYVSAGLPAFFVLLAAGWAALPRAGRVLAAIGAAALFTLSLAQHYGSREYAKEDFRDATRLWSERHAPGDCTIAAGNYSPLDYYVRDGAGRRLGERLGPRSYERYWLGYARDDRLEPQFDVLLRPGAATWVFVSRPYDLDPAGRFERWLVANRHPEVHDFPGVRLYRIAPGSADRGAEGRSR